MSKEEEGGCKLSSVCKHRERKPKKPHYIPRPWGKPYNYKCFQCPFTCMEKSHLYNHMKYSLCKNSLSLLIESDWPYKKSNFLIPEMHLVPEPQLDGHSEKEESCDSSGLNSAKARQVGHKETADVANFQNEEEEKEDEELPHQGHKEKVRNRPSLQISPCKSDANNTTTGLKGKREKPGKEGEPDFVITNVFSLEGLNEKEREEHRLAKVSRHPTSNIGVTQSHHWKLLSNSLKKAVPEVQSGSSGANNIPCYPPPTYTDYQDNQGLSLLGINYPLNTSLFSYLSPSVTSSSSHLPFLASTAQLMQPTHTNQFQAFQNTERSSYLPRFYYPLLFEHAFGTADNKMISGKPVSTTQPPINMAYIAPKPKTPIETLKMCLHKSPETKMNMPLGSDGNLTNQMSIHKVIQDSEVKWTNQTTAEIRQHQKLPGIYTRPVSSMNKSSMPQKGTDEGSLWAEPNTKKYLKRKGCFQSEEQDSGMEPTALLVGEDDFQNGSSCSSSVIFPNVWHEKKSVLELTACKIRKGSEPANDGLTPKNSNASLLIEDLSRTLEEYGKVERKLANLVSEDSSRQKALGDQLGKIRLELLRIHHTLEKASCPFEGPLDLSIKRVEDMSKVEADKTAPNTTVNLPRPKSPAKQLIKVEMLPPELASCDIRPTKCEADSSVLLCPDGRGTSAGTVQTHVSILDDSTGASVNIGLGRGQQQCCENV